MKNMFKESMFRKLVVTGMLAIVLFAFLAPQQAHARPTKDQLEGLFKKWDAKFGYDRWEIERALETMERTFKLFKGKNAEDLLDAAVEAGGGSKKYNFVKRIMALKEGFGLFVRWCSDKDSGSPTKLSNLFLDTIDFVAGSWVAGPYISTIISVGKEYLKAGKKWTGERVYVEEMIAADNRTRGWPLSGADGPYSSFGHAMFVSAWADGVYEMGQADTLRAFSIMSRIEEYCRALETVSAAGLLK